MPTTNTQTNRALGFASLMSYVSTSFPHSFMDLSKKASALLLALLLSACSMTAEQKIDRLERQNAEKRKSSGYDECMRMVEADEQKIKDCEVAKIIAAGYTDGLECVGTGETDPVCQSKERYNAEVNAHNTCPTEVEFETELTAIDCLDLMLEQ